MLTAHEFAGTPVPPGRLMTCGTAALTRGCFDTARRAFLSASASEQLVSIGDAAYENGDYVTAHGAYRDSARAIPAERLLSLGDALLREKQHHFAYCAFLTAANLGA